MKLEFQNVRYGQIFQHEGRNFVKIEAIFDETCLHNKAKAIVIDTVEIGEDQIEAGETTYISDKTEVTVKGE